MRVMQLASGDLWAGAEVQLYYLARALQADPGVELMVVLLNPGQLEQRLRVEGIRVEVLDESRLATPAIARGLYRLMRQWRPDLLHTHRSKENILGAIVATLCRVPSLRSVHGDAEIPRDHWKQRLIAAINRWTGRHLQRRLIAVSQELRDKLVADYPAATIRVIENSIDAAELESRASEPLPVALEPDVFHVALIGRLVAVKRVDRFIEIARELQAIAAEARICFHHLGDGPLLAEMRQRIGQAGLDEQRIRLHGFTDNTAPWIRRMDLLLFLSDHEGLPMTLLEAMTLETAVMYRRQLPTLHQLLCDGDCGFAIGEDEDRRFAEAILSLSADPAVIRDRARRARARLLADYDIAGKLGQYLELYRELV
jgi:glycosyltransferase involved in cell wall biosynthesis